MHTVVLMNRAAGAGSASGAEALRAALQGLAHIEVLEPTSREESAQMAGDAVRLGCTHVLVAGGDGTIHAIVNALSHDLHRVCFGVLPLGTGNDLCRTLAIPNDPVAALIAVETGQERRFDLIEAHTSDGVHLVVNVASGGFSGQLTEALTPEMKAIWGPLAYLRGAATAMADLHGYTTQIQFDDGAIETLDLLNVLVANGRFAAHGWRVASHANPEDGLLDVILVRNGTVFDLTDLAARLLTGDYLDSLSVVGRRARQVRVQATPGMWFSLDGERTTDAAITFRIRPRVLRILASQQYQAEPSTG